MKTKLREVDNNRLREIISDTSVVTYNFLAGIAIENIKSLPEFKKLHLLQVCGPVSTGLPGRSPQQRLQEIIDAGTYLSGRFDNVFVFDQAPYEEAIEAIKLRRLERGLTVEGIPDQAIIHQFYKPLFLAQSKKVKLFFLPDYEYSNGANEEHRLGLLYPEKIKIYYLKKNWREETKMRNHDRSMVYKKRKK